MGRVEIALIAAHPVEGKLAVVEVSCCRIANWPDCWEGC
jgi:hypothetical protein